MANDKKHSWVTPKRIKISSGIILVLIFGFVFDYLYPIHAENKQISQEEMHNNLRTIADAVQEYHSKTGKLPEDLLGGDKSSYRIAHNNIVDPLIEEGIIDCYPNFQFPNIEYKRALIEFKSEHPELNYLFGKDGNCICDLQTIYENTGFYDKFRKGKVNPFVGCFTYEKSSTDQPRFTIGIISEPFDLQDQTNKYDSYTIGYEDPDSPEPGRKYLELVDDPEVEYAIFWTSFSYENGQWKEERKLLLE